MKASWAASEVQSTSLWKVRGDSTDVPKCREWKPGCWRRVRATSKRTVAEGCEGLPMEVPGARGMRAISVVGILVVFWGLFGRLRWKRGLFVVRRWFGEEYVWM